ncbi:MAG: nitroreductase family protein [Oscillospiraceae bacterium]|nr:nitroreductase family protein [Oscillospiraceae bacterium]MBR2937796.1 nitroreductase family protein [Oscillospiraceae bacterium]
MNYAALIQNRKSTREFTDKQVSFPTLEAIRGYYLNKVHRLVPELKTQLYFFGTETRDALERAAGYHQFLIGAPQYLVLMSEKHPAAHLNAGFMMEDLILKLTELELDSCWLTFTDSEEIKEVLGIESDLEVAAIAAFGYGKKTVKRIKLNIRSMSDIDIKTKYRYMEPKRSVRELAFVDSWGSKKNLENYIGFFDDMLWEALYAASNSPSYLNRQAYGFVIRNGSVSLISRPDEYNTEIDGDLSLGVVLLHFTAVAEHWAGKIRWNLQPEEADLGLPEGHKLVAAAAI